MKEKNIGIKRLGIAIAGVVLLMGIAAQGVQANPIYNLGDMADGLSLDVSYMTDPSDSAALYRWYWDAASQFSIDFELVVGSEDIVDGSDFAAIDRALGTWTDVGGSSIVGASSSFDGDWAGLNGDNEIGWIESEWTEKYGFSSNAIAAAVTWYHPGTLIQVETDIFVNGDDFTWYTDTDDSGEGQDVEHILLHELGHAFSLADLYDLGDSERTMYGYSGYMDEDVTLHSYDELALSYAYPTLIPEPASLFLLLGGLIGLAARHRKRWLFRAG